MNGRHGLVSVSGTTLLEPKYEEIIDLDSPEVFAVREDGEIRIIDINGEEILEGNFDDFVHIRGDSIVAGRNGQYGIVNREGEEIVPLQYEEIRFAFGETYIARRNGQYGVINLENEVVLDFDYLSLVYIEEGDILKADVTEIESVIISSNFEERISGIVSEINIDEGFIRLHVDGEHKFFNFRLEERRVSDVLTSNTLFLDRQDGRYGFIDAYGNVVIEHVYDDATEQNRYGFAGVKRDGKWGAINRIGREVLTPSVNLDNNVFVDFIGEWHLDVSGLFYTR
ncbi:MAG: WG repeat-containing protein [Oscillospiraceae bacterium]|nr:WG repeat-containing protein [Oscillospiraceae bacterium]